MAVNHEALRGMALSNLRELNNAIVAEINHRNAEVRRGKMAQFKRGDTAQFTCSRTGRLVTCRIDKPNTKTINVTELGDDGEPRLARQWRVSPSALTLMHA